ncbi:hypothetical protein [Actibacterium pelagium]|nr:hypothetical protein [Actibacterium pelagium]
MILAIPLAACTAPAPTELPLIRGYRAPADQCQLVGENAFTNQYLDHTADLVACPVGYEGTGVFVTETGAVFLETLTGYDLFSVPTNQG